MAREVATSAYSLVLGAAIILVVLIAVSGVMSQMGFPIWRESRHSGDMIIRFILLLVVVFLASLAISELPFQ